MTSLREGLLKINVPQPGLSIPAIPSGFTSFPKSLKEAIHAMNPPIIEAWINTKTGEHDNEVWTEECQGLTTDGQSWYVVSNNEDDEGAKGVYKFTFNFDFLGFVPFPEVITHHVGAPDYYRGKIYVPIEDAHNARVWVLKTDLTTVDIFPLGSPPQGGANPWCAVNPWNEHLYSSDFGNNFPEEDGPFHIVNQIYAYDLKNDTFAYSPKKDIILSGGPPVHRVQGGCISKNGHLYLSCDTRKHLSGHIHAYSTLNGAYLGSHKLLYVEDVGHGEVEGMSINHILHNDGSSTYAHLIVLDNDAFEDDIYLYHFVVPDPNVI